MKKKIELWAYCAILSAVNLVCFNIPFLSYAWNHAEKWIIVPVLVLLLLLLNFFACYLASFLLRRAGRVLVAVCHFLSTVCVYYIFAYQTMMDESMIANFFNTRPEEAGPFITLPFVLCGLVIGLLPSIWIVGAKVNYGSWKRFGKSVGISLGAALLLILVNLNQTLWIGEHDTELGGLTMPWSYLVNTARHFNHQKADNREEILLPDATFANDEKRAVVLVIGESARSANCSLYGYERETNPRLARRPDLHVLNAQSCATYTTASVKAILEDRESSELYEILPNYLYRMGADVQWRTTNWGEPPVKTPYYKRADLASKPAAEADKYDAVLLNGLRDAIDGSSCSKVLVVLHTSTSHGPGYCHKYPAEFEHYTPVCDNVEDAAKNPQALINAYDNTLLYTDWLLDALIDTLQTITDRSCAMFYISDHGESLGENNLYMHGVPIKVAPREQYEIPCFVWVSEGYRPVGRPAGIDQHWVFHSVLDLLDVDSPVYRPDRDLFAPQAANLPE